MMSQESSQEQKTCVNDDLEQIKEQGLTVTLVSLLKNSLTEAQYNSLHAIFQFKSVIALNLISKWSIQRWTRAVGDSFTAEMFHSLFSENKFTSISQNSQNKQLKQEEECSTIMCAYSTELPVSKGCDRTGKCCKPLHLKTDWPWNSDLMYNIEFKGHLFMASKPIFIIAVGYLYLDSGHVYDSIQYVSDGVKLSVCKTKDEKMAFKLETENNLDWHASDLVLNLIGGKNGYHQKAKDSFKIIDVCHSNENM